ncbi:conserved hypothetical protein [Talaromyces stipitatus ATCC 10500]|uniref:Tyrosine specific protein phosphatases domain-containing protein n=1 Tax=Talaromyces stipitatus (strain ATCC 10500 / CBS 375.48 / QM 6759 / NRRL 1006) TaxID=441959 RepID=B8MPK0_TALSN|nr:uncharacterized protein TSTA_106490 [Talaromyces stipitatus ATCC 10500]EED14439.1 conserved hypothetical protein [Talaromyces stipitatus ATCC 10500]
MANVTTAAASAVRLESPPPRFLSVGGVVNIRELGGHSCNGLSPTPASKSSPDNKLEVTPRGSDDLRIRPGFLFRSAQPSQITPAGIETLIHELGIKSIFDFRSQTEIELVTTRYPDSLLEIPGTTRYSVPVFREGDFSPVSLAKKYGVASNNTADPTNAKPAGFVQAYEAIARSGAENGSFRKITDYILRHPDRPVLFHCTLGKDRTGVFAALLLKLCGVPNDTVIEDYAITTEGLGTWREHLIQRLLQRKEAVTREDAEFIIASQPENMKSFLEDVVMTKFGGARNYFIQYCGLTEDEVDTDYNLEIRGVQQKALSILQ